MDEQSAAPKSLTALPALPCAIPPVFPFATISFACWSSSVRLVTRDSRLFWRIIYRPARYHLVESLRQGRRGNTFEIGWGNGLAQLISGCGRTRKRTRTHLTALPSSSSIQTPLHSQLLPRFHMSCRSSISRCSVGQRRPKHLNATWHQRWSSS